jgi:ABC-2 type transport system ATP-binding protein
MAVCQKSQRAPGGSLLICEQLSKDYDGFQDVKHLTRKVELGEIFGFLGLNGAGKTSTIKMLMGLLVA